MKCVWLILRDDSKFSWDHLGIKQHNQSLNGKLLQNIKHYTLFILKDFCVEMATDFTMIVKMN